MLRTASLSKRSLLASRAISMHNAPIALLSNVSFRVSIVLNRGISSCSSWWRNYTVPSFDTQSTVEKDSILRDLFDLPAQNTVGSQYIYSGNKTGLLLESRFVSPDSFRKAGREAMTEANALLQRALSAETFDERRSVVKCLDQLSDALCRVMDVAELIRQVHPDRDWQTAADAVYADMFEFMNGLNTHVALYKKLVEVMEDPEISNAFSPVETEVALSFRRDFERSGIHLSKSAHTEFVALSSDIQDLSREFYRRQTAPDAYSTLPVPLDHLRSLPSQVVEGIKMLYSVYRRDDGVQMVDLEVNEAVAHYVLRDCKEESTREAVYRRWQHGDTKAVRTLETMLEKRLKLANTVGYSSFGEMALDDKMAKSPSHVDEFLRALAKQAQPQWKALADSLWSTKSQCQPSPVFGKTTLQPWDRDFLSCQQQMKSGTLPPLSQYFSLGRVVLGLSRIFQSLYGVELRASTPRPGETWHPDVRKLEVIDENSHILGIVYCDVFGRNDKAHVGAAHFTARCARRIDDDIETQKHTYKDTGETVVERDGKRYQLPVVVLICDFPAPSMGSPPLLTWGNVETIFHEMGHAMHSMLGQNDFHNVAGTRCAVDFVELPSILMEHFARSPQVLSLFASHYQTGAPLPPALIRQHAKQKRRYGAIDLHAQLFMSALDQRYHSRKLDPAGTCSPNWSTRALAKLHNDPMLSAGSNSSLFGYVTNTRWQWRFSHLLGYGASYYAYLFDRVLAGQIWDRVFEGDYPIPPEGVHGISNSRNPLNREAGERFKNEVLRWGGGRNPWKCLANVLDNGITPKSEIEAVSQGNKAAMRIVGSWRLPE